jgi:hypothetical protein
MLRMVQESKEAIKKRIADDEDLQRYEKDRIDKVMNESSEAKSKKRKYISY